MCWKLPPNRCRPRRQLLVFAFLLLLTILMGGCLSRPALVKESFAFAPAAGTNTPAQNGPVLGIRRLLVSSPFDSQSFVYRTGEFTYEHDPYAEFLAAPADLFTDSLREYLRATGAFAGVAEPGSALEPSLQAEVTIVRLYGDFRQASRPAAVLEMRFVLFATTNASKVYFQKDYAERVPITRRTAASLVAGWNQALKSIVGELTRDLEQKGQ